MTVSARAVAYEGNGPNCIYVMNPIGVGRDFGQRQRHGEQQLRAAGGLELVERLDGQRQSSVTAPTIGVVGNYTSNGNTTFSPTPKTGVIAASDPLAYVNAPTVGSCAHTNFSLNGNNGSSGSPYQLYAGHLLRRHLGQRQFGAAFQRGNLRPRRRRDEYKWQLDDDRHGGDLLQHDGDQWLRGDHDERQLAGEFQRADLGSAGGNPVLSGSLDSEHGAGSTINGNSSSTFDGAIYFATTTVTFNGNSSANGYSIVVANQLVLNGNASARQQLFLADERIADKRNDTGRMSAVCKSRRGRSAHSGQASVELALSLPLLLMMFLVVVETGRAFYIAISVANAARAGVQYGSQNLSTAAR